MKKRSEQELNAQNSILEAHHKKRQAEAEAYMKDMAEKCHKQQENLKARLARLHEERFERRRSDLHAECTLSLGSDAQYEARGGSNQAVSGSPGSPESEPSPRGQRTGKGAHEGSVSHDAVVRQKQRKGLMNSATIQLAVEIHNEGIIALTRSNQQDGDDSKFSPNDKSNGRSSVFLPWGQEARSFLYSIIVGEIPSGYFLNQIGGVGRGALTGGLCKCMITDTRTSDDTAFVDRTETFSKVKVAKNKAQVEEISLRYKNALNAMSTLQSECTLLAEREEKIAAAHKDAALQFERAKQTLDKFKNQAQHFFNQGKFGQAIRP